MTEIQQFTSKNVNQAHTTATQREVNGPQLGETSGAEWKNLFEIRDFENYKASWSQSRLASAYLS